MGEREIQPGGQDYVILLERRGGYRRIGHVDIAERILPSQPLAQLGDAAEVEGHTILPAIAEVRVEIQLLGEKSRSSQLAAQFFSERKGHEAVRNRIVVLSRIVWADQKIQRCFVRIDGVESQSSPQNTPKVQFLQGIGLEIGPPVAKQPGGEISSVPRSRLVGVCGRTWARPAALLVA